ncbi:MAG: alpha/beta fold hydrolase, partial [Bacteroidales bacterium]|nr:alpha/beta fold hydrolase [Bacteroidales bacterium]
TLFECVNEGLSEGVGTAAPANSTITQSHINAMKSDTALIAITGIHGNFYSNPFYYTVGDTLAESGFEFVYAQTCDAFGTIRTRNVRSGKMEIIGSWNERFTYAEEDVEAWVDWAERRGYRHIYLAGHSLGANKVICYLSQSHDPRVERFLLLSPANLDYMTSGVTAQERDYVRSAMKAGMEREMLPFPLMGWVECQVATAYDWLFSGILNNVHTRPDRDFSQLERITHCGALLIGTYDNFTDGDPSGFLCLTNSHMPTAAQNKLIFIERTGHTYQMKHQELADSIMNLIVEWTKE